MVAAESQSFHPGECKIQERLGVRDQVEALGRRLIHDHMPDQHRIFYSKLPMLLVGSIDEAGRPWASALFGRPGFVSSPDPRTLMIGARPVFGDPLNQNLAPEAEIGLLGIEFPSRRRNRMNATVSSLREGEIGVRVKQAFGNCPQYIQTRDLEILPAIDRVGVALPVSRLHGFGEPERRIIGRADSFFIASHFSKGGGNATHGADVSHRGGKPGFVRIDDHHALTFPDFSGNLLFNTLGNILLNPRTGLLFIDFENNDLLYLTGTAVIIWDSEEKRAFTGAERLIRFTLEEGIRIQGVVPIQWRFLEYSPSLEQTGCWEEVAATLAARHQGNVYQNYRVTRVIPESANVTSFYLQREDGLPLRCHAPGQFLSLQLHPPGSKKPVRRTYTISSSPNGIDYRLSIKREALGSPGSLPGSASSYIHDCVKVGSILRAMSPRGKFTLVKGSLRPIVLLSAGVGITPMVSMLEHLVANANKCGCQRAVWFIHGARNGAEHAFRNHVRELTDKCVWVDVHIRYSRPSSADQQGRDYDSVGRIDINLVKSLLTFDDYDFFLCGPTGFMRSLYEGLKLLNISDDRIHYEFFGKGQSLHCELQHGFESANPRGGVTVPVIFKRSAISTIWDPSKGTLLDLAESKGLNPAYSCRSGICRTCSTRLVTGKVKYLEPPMAAPNDGEALICCCYPSEEADGVDADQGVVLDI